MATNTNLLIEDIKHRMEWVKQVLAEFCPLAEDTSKELDEIRDLAVKASTSDSSSTRLTTEQGLDQAYEQTKLLLESSAARHAPTVIQTHLGSGDGPARTAEPQEPTYHLSAGEQDTMRKALLRSANVVEPQERETPRTEALNAICEIPIGTTWTDYHQRLAIHALSQLKEQIADLKRVARYETDVAQEAIDTTRQLERELSQAREQIAFFQTCGIIELAIRNPNVSSYVNEWEGRAERAEQQLAKFRKQLGTAVVLMLQSGDTECEQFARDIPVEFPNCEPTAASPKVTP